jgi:four helix bundle protein
MRHLDHEKLHVYQTALDFLALADVLIATLPRGHAYLADQLYRAAASICLNIAEGAGEFSPLDKARFYRIARRSATECAAILDVCGRLRLASPDQIAPGRELLVQTVVMLTTLARRRTESARAES